MIEQEGAVNGSAYQASGFIDKIATPLDVTNEAALHDFELRV
jgi:hypothetical protein